MDNFSVAGAFVVVDKKENVTQMVVWYFGGISSSLKESRLYAVDKLIIFVKYFWHITEQTIYIPDVSK